MADSLFIPGQPIAQPRPRARVMPIGRGKHRAQIYHAAGPIDGWRERLAVNLAQHRPLEPMAGVVRVSATFYLPRRKYHAAKKYGVGAIPCGKKPDSDNFVKPVLDEMTSAGYWHDDGEVWLGAVEKYYHAVGGSAGVMVTVEAVEMNGLFELTAEAGKE